MSLKNKIEKIRKSRPKEFAGGEKTGVLNGLMVLGAIAGAMLLSGAAHAQPECDPNTHEITGTKIVSGDSGIDTSSWSNHCWWNHHAFNAGGACFHFSGHLF